ncbi:MAG TPA: DUF3365 domain-containing protein [Cytophagaceae bacterium]
MLIAGFAVVLSGCEGDVDTRGVATQIKDRKIRKVTDSQVLSAAEAEAGLILSTVDSVWKAKLAGRKDGQVSACNLDSIFETIKKTQQVAVSRVGLKPIGETAVGDSIEKQLLDSYLYNAEQKLPMRSNTQRLGTKQIIYTAPITLNSNDCLNCHGDDKTVSQTTSAALQKTYPKYKSQDFKKDSLIGMWSVVFLKKELIRKIK